MLERTTLCLESGSLRRLLPIHRSSLKAQSSHHSKFRNHRRIILDLIPIVAVLAQRVGGSLEQRVDEPCFSSKALYDFLRPTFLLQHTSNVRDYSGEILDRRLAPFWVRNLSRRNYSSSTLHSSSDLSQENIELSGNSNFAVTDLIKKMNLSDQFDPNKAWKKFTKFDENEKKLFRKSLLHYLHISGDEEDNQRVIQLFEELNLVEKDTTVCQLVVQSYLRLNNYLSAIDVYKFAIERFNIPIGCGGILYYFLRNKYWSKAFTFWMAEPSLVSDFNFLRSIDDFSLSVSSAILFSSWVNKNEKDALVTKFATIIMEKTLISMNTRDQHSFHKLIKSIENWTVHKDFYSNIVASLAKNRKKTQIMKFYRIARDNKNFFLSRAALITVLQEFCHEHEVLGIRQVLDDFFSIYSKPSRAAYRICLKEFAKQGDAETVHALFKQYISRYKDNTYKTLAIARHNVKKRSYKDKSGGSYCSEEIDEAAPLTSNDFAPLLHAHAKRGEVKEIEKLFDQIPHVYKVRLDILCWNIRLSAYCKTQNIEKAYSCFEEILNDSFLKPDHYTLGTMMSMCAHRSDLRRARDIFEFANELNIPHSSTMINMLVICLVRNHEFSEAEEICKAAVAQNIAGVKVEMWNSLLIGYAQRRDLKSVNRILNIMSRLNIEYNQYTYSALMHALVMTRQPSFATKILFKIMPESEISSTSFNYAVLLGGYLAVRDFKMFDQIYQHFLDTKIKPGISTKFLLLRAAATQETISNEEDIATERFERSLTIFFGIMASIDPQDLSETARKVGDEVPIDILYPSLFYSFMAYILSIHGGYKTSIELLDQYSTLIPEDRRKAGQTIRILTALMVTKNAASDYSGVKECWEKIVSLAKEVSSPLLPIPKISPLNNTPKTFEVAYNNRFRLNLPFWFYMKSLTEIRRTTELKITVEELVASGFELDNRNWNEFVKALARTSKYYKFAFQICEFKLMSGFQGWRIQRHKLAGYRYKIDLNIRRAKLNQTSLRPYFDTIMMLTRRVIDLQAQAAENPQIQIQINILKRENPLTFVAIENLPRNNDERILKSDKSQFEI